MARKETKETNELASNRKARHDHFTEDSLEASLVLVGTEVKFIRKGSVSLAGTYVSIQKDEVYAENIHITPYEEGNRFNASPLEKGKLLLYKKEVQKLKESLDQRGRTLAPLKLYLVWGRAKMELGPIQGKKLCDKRQALREKEINKKLRDFTEY